MPTLSSLVEQAVVITTSGAPSDAKVGIMAALGFQLCIYAIRADSRFASSQ